MLNIMALGGGIVPFRDIERVYGDKEEATVIEATPENVIDSEVTEEVSTEEESLFDQFLALDPDEFAGLTVKQQNLILFVLLRDMSGEVRSLADKVNEFEEKARDLASPEGIRKAIDAFMGGSDFGGMLGMLR